MPYNCLHSISQRLFQTFYETLQKCKTSLDDMQNARTKTLGYIFLELWPLKIENSKFYQKVHGALSFNNRFKHFALLCGTLLDEDGEGWEGTSVLVSKTNI